MQKLKGKDLFTELEIENLKNLIKKRIVSTKNQQKHIREQMRNIGFYGRDDWGIYDLQLSNFEELLINKKIQIKK